MANNNRNSNNKNGIEIERLKSKVLCLESKFTKMEASLAVAESTIRGILQERKQSHEPQHSPGYRSQHRHHGGQQHSHGPAQYGRQCYGGQQQSHGPQYGGWYQYGGHHPCDGRSSHYYY